MSRPARAVYAEGCMYPHAANPQPVPTTISQVQQSGFQSLILGLFHIGRDYDIQPAQIMGDLYYNDTLVFSKGQYVGDASWPGQIGTVIGGTVDRVCASIGGGYPVMDFQTIRKIYADNNNSFDGTNLMANFKALRQTLPAISVIDMDCEDTYDRPSFVAFCRMLIGMGFDITFCPYTNQSFWVDCLADLNTGNPGAVAWWNLQCYDGGAQNRDPQTFQGWATAITQAIPGFDTDAFIMAGDWTNDSPDAVKALMQKLEGEPAFGGGFLWTLDAMLSGGETLIAAYAQAIPEGVALTV
ncbi:hypothetical protein [Eilatimonas milleporae]|uniref:Glycosyl hydrolase family 18 (Putative chitinase) n=1 Tax=Eilatimonas milleporae TaxID=911205 RepID=A0A3M0CEG3_9PROT|nr:hypothetical protein [Eilatimonas milleporae]RMB07742.1 hypothetical protein BXY39_1831 [Eilatimonas milleporae]